MALKELTVCIQYGIYRGQRWLHVIQDKQKDTVGDILLI